MIDYINFKRPDIPLYHKSGRYVTGSLFLETKTDNEELIPFYTLCEEEKIYKGKVLPSAYKVILNSISEFDAAERLLGSYNHWKELKKSARIYKNSSNTHNGVPLGEALYDMKMRIKNQASKTIYAQMEEGSVTAAKIIYSEAVKQLPSSKIDKEKDKGGKTVFAIEQFRDRMNNSDGNR